MRSLKKFMAFTLAFVLLMVCTVATAITLDAMSGATPASDDTYAAGGLMKTLGKERIFTRNGPATKFRDTGTYTIAGGEVRAYSYAYDREGDCWVQIEFTHKNKLRRLYTRLEDMDIGYFDPSGLQEEEPLGYRAKVKAVTKLLYGPGEEYDTYGNSFKSTKGATVYITAIEGDYAQVEWAGAKQSYRVWVPLSILSY